MYRIEGKGQEFEGWNWVGSVVGTIGDTLKKVGTTAWDVAKETLPIVGPYYISYELGQRKVEAEQAIVQEQIQAQKELAMLQIQTGQVPGSTAGSTALGLPIGLPVGLTTKDILLYGGIAFGGLALLMILPSIMRRPKKEV